MIRTNMALRAARGGSCGARGSRRSSSSAPAFLLGSRTGGQGTSSGPNQHDAVLTRTCERWCDIAAPVARRRYRSGGASRAGHPQTVNTGRPAQAPESAPDPAAAGPAAVATIQASAMASSCQASYRPLRPPWPATISVFSRNGPPDAVACSLAIHFAGSVYSTRVSLRLVIARIGGYRRPETTVAEGLYDFT